MTQKELLYVEDAIGHEKSLIKILEEEISSAKDDEIVEFLEEEVTIHQNIEDKLTSLLEEKA